ncbi:MAG TPA: TonB-dependent receptor [Terricaulis sp.]|nr:TonB-dependent receptor [Terricaulis sp.]
MASAAAIAAFSAAPAWANEISGQVTDRSEVQSLEGAQIEIVELRRSTQSAIDGRFRFADVPAGQYTLRVRYAAAAPQTLSVTVPATGVSNVNIALAAAAGTDEILVIGQRASLASSISRQRASDTVETVLTRDGIGHFPDQNVAESVRRAPGVNVLNDQGEGRFVAVRGLSPDLNAASINGVRVTAPEADVRSVALDVIPSDLIESIEIQKSLTPDMDADSLGGSINIQTTRGFDRREPLLAFRGEMSYNDLNTEWSPRYSVDFARAFGNLGVAGGLSYTNRTFSTDNVEMDGWDEEGGIAFAETVEYRDYDVERTRIGGSFSLDYRLGNHTTLYARGLHSIFEDQEYRGRLTFESGADALTGGTATSASFLSLDDEDGMLRVERDMKDRYEEQTISSLLFGGETDLNSWRFRYEASWSFAEEQERGSLDPVSFRRDFENPGELGVTFDYANWRIPGYTITAGEALFLDPEEFEFNEVERTSVSDSQDEEFAYRLDATRTFALAQGSFELQFGARQRFRDKTYDANIDFYEMDDLTLADFLGAASYGLADIDPIPSQTSFRPFFNQNFAGFERALIDSTFDSLVSDYAVEENISAAYVMGRYENGPLRVIGGLRYERTEQEVSANLVELVEEGGVYAGSGTLVADDDDQVYVTPTGFERSYENWLPSVNLRFEAGEDVVLRAGVYRSVLRPRPGQIAPRFMVEQNDGGDREGEFGNPALEPYEAWNYDATAEWYFASNAVLQAGVFYKTIDNFIVDLSVDGRPDDPFGGVFNGVAYDEAVIPVNGEEATVWGFELGYAQALDFLPSVLGGLVISANYTYTDSEGEVFGRTIQLPASSEHTYNITLGYDSGPLDVRFAISYRDGYLDELGGAPGEDRLIEEHIQYDLTVKYDITDRVQIYTEFVNLGDEPYVAYQTGPAGAARLLQYEEYSWTGKIGLRAQF